MGKLIAVWGTPESGKSTFSVKLAETIYHHFRERRSVVLVFTDDISANHIRRVFFYICRFPFIKNANEQIPIKAISNHVFAFYSVKIDYILYCHVREGKLMVRSIRKVPGSCSLCFG